jgi:hypothetical protein
MPESLYLLLNPTKPYCQGVTVILLTCSYQDKEFIRIGYYVNVGYSDPELNENPPEVPDLSRLSRSILIDHPRVTRFACDFDNSVAASGGEVGAMDIGQDGGAMMMQGEMAYQNTGDATMMVG